jgi:hypothetical protein
MVFGFSIVIKVWIKEMNDFSNNSDIFVWTEAFNCAELLNPLLKSYCEVEVRKVHAYLFDYEFSKITYFNDKIEYQVIPTKLRSLNQIKSLRLVILGRWIKSGYKKGHLGTARFWSVLIKSRNENLFVHFDSDILFVQSVVNTISEELKNGSVCVGRRRMYKYNLNNVDKVRHKRDCIDTVLFGFNARILKFLPLVILVPLIRGKGFISRIFPTLDFFDKITFLLSKFGKLTYVDSPDSGNYGHVNSESNFCKSFLEIFSAVGTGCALWNKHVTEVSLDMNKLSVYQKYALSNYSFYSKYILRNPIDYHCTEDPQLVGELRYYKIID